MQLDFFQKGLWSQRLLVGLKHSIAGKGFVSNRSSRYREAQGDSGE